MRFFRHYSMRSAILVAGVTAAIGGGAVATQWPGSVSLGHAPPAGVRAQDAAISTGACDEIHRQIQDGDDVDVDKALQCDQREFAVLEQDRLAGKTDNQVKLSATCDLVNKRLADGDADVDEDLATACRNRELFALNTDASNESGSSDRLTSMCIGKKKLDKTDDGAPDFEKDACSDKPFGREPLPVSEEVPAPSASNPPVSNPSASPAFDFATQCAPIKDAIVKKQTFDAQLGEKCIEEESDPTHVGSVTHFGPICQALDGAAAAGDLDFPVNVVLACEKTLERGVQRDDGSLEKPTDICVTARNQQSAGTTIDPALDQVCAKEPASPPAVQVG
jgi:hypothetical protein